MLELGFIDDVEQIAAACPQSRQTLLFSATLEGEVEKVARAMLKNPAQIQVAGMNVPHANIEQRMFWADDGRHKRELLLRVLRDPEMKQALIFTNTRRLAAELAEQLTGWGVPCEALHGEMALPARRRAVDRLKRGQVQFLVATDVASRGLDLRGLTHVVNFDLPRAPEDYIHRIGRTGRAADRGIAVSLVLPRERAALAAIERASGKKIEARTIPGLEPKVAEQKHAPAGRREHSDKRPHPRFRTANVAGPAKPSTPNSAAAASARGADAAPLAAKPAASAHSTPHHSHFAARPGFKYSKDKKKLKKVRYRATTQAPKSSGKGKPWKPR
jgi:superfamily II DNA/RNA helicase